MVLLEYKKIGKFIAEERVKSGLTQEQLAEKLFVTRQVVSKWERGMSLPNYDFLILLCNIFNVTSNEILAGERKSVNNKEYINNYSINILEDSVKKRKKLIFRFSIIIILMLLLFLFYYFISTYNKLEVYLINGESDIFEMSDTIAVLSNEATYIKLGSPISDIFDVKYINVYYIKDDSKKDMLTSSFGDRLIIQNNGYNEYFDSKDTKIMLNNLYIDIYYNDGQDDLVDTIKLEVNRLYNNDKLLFKKDKLVSEESNNSIDDVDIPEEIKNKFKEDENGNYFIIYTKNKKNISISYEPVSNTIIVKEENDNVCEEYIYLRKYNIIKYTLTSNDVGISSEATINKDIICTTEECKNHEKKYDYFIKEYDSYLN